MRQLFELIAASPRAALPLQIPLKHNPPSLLMGPAAATRAVLVGATLVATAWAGGTRRVGSDWPHHGVGSAPRIPIGYPLPAPRAVRSPQGRTVVVKGDAAARSNNDAPDLRPWWRRQAIADPNAAWVEELLKKNCANGSFWLPLTDHGPTKFAQGAALGARSGLLDLKKVSANHIIIFLLESAETATREPAPETFCGNSTVPCYGELRAPPGSHADGLRLRAARYRNRRDSCRDAPANVVCVRLEGLRKRPLDLFRHLTDVMGMQCATDETSLVSVAPPATTTTALSSADMAGVRAGIDLDVEKELGYAYEGAADAGAVVVEFPLVTRKLLLADADRKLLFANDDVSHGNETNSTRGRWCESERYRGGARSFFWSGCRAFWTTRDYLVNAALAVGLVCLVAAHIKIRGFDGPVRDDGVAPECLEAAQRSHGGPQGLHALLLWLGGSVLLCWFIWNQANARTTFVGGAAHLLAFLLFAIYPGCLGEPCGKRGCGRGGCVPTRITTGIIGWVCCACGAFCFGVGGWQIAGMLGWYCFCCHPCAFIFINIARCAAFSTPLRRRDAQDPNTPPTPAQQWLPAVATEWAPPMAAVELAPVPPTVVEQPTATLPSAKAVLP